MEQETKTSSPNLFCNTCGSLLSKPTRRCFKCERDKDPMYKAGFYREQLEREMNSSHPQARWPRCPKCGGLMHPKNSLGVCHNCFVQEQKDIGL